MSTYFTTPFDIEDAVGRVIEIDKVQLDLSKILVWKLPKELSSNSTTAESYKKIWLYYYD